MGDWTSNLQAGALTTGVGQRVSLAAGTHVVTLTATAPGGGSASDSVTLYVR